MGAAQRNRLIGWLAIVVFGIAAGYFYANLGYSGANGEIAVNPWRGARAGAMIAGATAAFEIFGMRTHFGAWLRRLPFAASFVLHLLISTALVIACLYINVAIRQFGSEGFAGGYKLEDLIDDTMFSLAAMSIAILGLETTRYIGVRNILRLATGRYYRPIPENRIFAIFDVAGSTEAARKLGDRRFHEYLSAVFFDIDQPIVDHGGEVHSYIGDAVLVSWLSNPGRKRADVLPAVRAVLQTLRRRQPHYRQVFGIEPRLRAAIHSGAVMAGQCGDSRRQITYLGEALNVTARIETLAKTLGHDFLISAAARQHIEVPTGMALNDAGFHQLRGVPEPVQVFWLDFAPTV